ncbi:MAG TPA: hypothetical protein VG269_29675 [Tepidisphaeraceae bacterium]|nr:hypothetical protein [Tepidisphaeraceae bacterium]
MTSVLHHRRPPLAFTLGLLAAFSVAPALGSYVSPFPNIGQAGGYTVFGLDTTIDGVGGTSTIKGDVAVGPNGSLTLGGNSVVTGTVFRDPSATVSVGGGSTVGGTVVQNMTLALDDAFGAAAAFSSHAADQTISGNLTSSTSFSPVDGGTKFIDVNGNVSLGGSNTLTFNGTADDYYVVNVSGTFALGGTADIQLAGGITPQDLFFNIEFSDASQNGLQLASGTHSLGTFLVPFSEVTLDGGTSASPVVTGAIIGDGHNIAIQSTAWVEGAPSPLTVSPEPTSLASLGACLLLISLRRRSVTPQKFATHTECEC